jgi:hypothetical protein
MDYNKYHPDWKDVIRPLALKRAGYKCLVCGIRHKSRVYLANKTNYVECDAFLEEWAKSTGKKVFTMFLQVAHLDHNKSNNSLNNLRVLCPRHHGLFDKEHKRMLKYTLLKESEADFKHVDVLELTQLQECIEALRISVKQYTNVTISKLDADNIINSISKYI